jgi:hypothetical protein
MSRFWFYAAWATYALSMKPVQWLLRIDRFSDDLDRLHVIALACFFMICAVYHAVRALPSPPQRVEANQPKQERTSW